MEAARKPDALLLAYFMLHRLPIHKNMMLLQFKKKKNDLSHHSISVFYDSNFLKVEQSYPHTCFF